MHSRGLVSHANIGPNELVGAMSAPVDGWGRYGEADATWSDRRTRKLPTETGKHEREALETGETNPKSRAAIQPEDIAKIQLESKCRPSWTSGIGDKTRE